MSPHTDAGAMLKLAEAGERHADGLTAQLDKPDWRLSRAHVEQARNSIRKLAEQLRQAASQGNAGGEPALRAALQEIDEIGRKITDFKNEHGIRMGNIAHAALLGAGTAAQAPTLTKRNEEDRLRYVMQKIAEFPYIGEKAAQQMQLLAKGALAVPSADREASNG